MRPSIRARLLRALLLALLVSAALPLPGLAALDTTVTPTVGELVGQKLMVAMAGTEPDTALLGRVERGEVGGVILFGSNIVSAAQVRSLTTALRHAASVGGQPPPLIATDQEGGSVRRVPWAPPTLSPPQLGALDSATAARGHGAATGIALACAGIDTDLAPVADVPASSSSFLERQGRTWSSSASVTATLADAFTTGLEDGHVVPAMKHFPGLGFATRNTDDAVVTITASKAALKSGLLPYQRAIGHGLPLVMLSNATYPAYDGANAAGWSHAFGTDVLRGSLGFTGVTMTDSLDGTAAARGVSATSLALRAARAGTDILLLTGSEASTAATYASLRSAASAGTLPRATLQASYARIRALKDGLVPPPSDSTPPAVTAPVSSLVAGDLLGTSTVPVATSWSAADPCGISATTLERRRDGGAWVVQPGVRAGTRSVDQPLGVAVRDEYAVHEIDGAGNAVGWAYGTTFEPLVAQQTDNHVRLGGPWHTVADRYASAGSEAASSAAGASATFTFSGVAVGWVAARGPDRGQVKVYVDGAYRHTIDLHASTYRARRLAYVQRWPANGSHTLRIVVVGTAGHPRVDVDAFVRLLVAPG